MAADVAADAVAGEQRRAAEQRVAGTFEVHAFGQMLDGEPVVGEPGVEVAATRGRATSWRKRELKKRWRNTSPALAVKTRSGRPGCGVIDLDLHAEPIERVVQLLPLLVGQLARRCRAIGSSTGLISYSMP